MSKAEGIYMSTDYRVTQLPSGKLIDDASVKFLSVRYPPDNGGPTALFGYIGLAILPDKTPTGVWIRETLRGKSEVFDQSMAHLRSRLDRDIAPLGVFLQVTVLVVQGGRRYFGALSNLKRGSRGQLLVSGSFGYAMQESKEPFAFAAGSGAARVAADRHLDLLNAQLAVWPRRPRDHMKLLASVNRKVAADEKTVSPFCHVSFVNADERTSGGSEVFTQSGEGVPFEMPELLFGIDLSGVSRRLVEWAAAKREGRSVGEPYDDSEAMNEELKRRP